MSLFKPFPVVQTPWGASDALAQVPTLSTVWSVISPYCLQVCRVALWGWVTSVLTPGSSC